MSMPLLVNPESSIPRVAEVIFGSNASYRHALVHKAFTPDAYYYNTAASSILTHSASDDFECHVSYYPCVGSCLGTHTCPVAVECLSQEFYGIIPAILSSPAAILVALR